MNMTVESLESFPLFAGLPAADVAAIAARCRWLEVDEGRLLFDLDTDTLEVYFVLEGAVRILTGRPEREVALADVLAGNYFGELAAIDGRKRSARVVATVPSRLASLDGDAFRQVLLDFPMVAVRVLERLARIIRTLDQRVTELSTTSEATRVCGELVRLAQPDPHGSGWIIPDLPNHAEIAAWVGGSREVVAQSIGELARDGVVRRRGMGLIIADWPRLQLLARG